MIDFPASPTNGQVFTSGAQSWTYDGTKWVAAGNAVMPPLATGDNRIINGDMRIDQRNNGAAVVPTATFTYIVDRWQLGVTQPSKFSVRQVGPSAITIPMGFPYFLQATSQSAYPPLTADSFYFQQRIEADMIGDFAFGTPQAQPLTLSFWANTTIAGTYSGAVCNGANDRSYVFTFPLSAAGLQKVVIPIPGDTGGTWTLGGNAAGMNVRFDLGTGTTFRTTVTGAWVAGQFVGVTSAVNICATNSAIFALTGVKLEIGAVATPFNRQSLAKSMADCQRYYQALGGQPIWSGQITTGLTYYTWGLFTVAMRTSPTLTLADVNNSGFPAGAPTTQNVGPYGYQAYKSANATAASGYYGFSYIASAEL